MRVMLAMGSQNKAKRKAMEKAFKRQKGRCALCGEQMKLNGKPDDPLMATADHILPKSRGGKIQGNIQAAHRFCNIVRGNNHMQDIDLKLPPRILNRKG
jgi:5-methylcytosine-specific restriction endonuclease McrA